MNASTPSILQLNMRIHEGIVQITNSSRDKMSPPLLFVTLSSRSVIISEYAWQVLKQFFCLLPFVVFYCILIEFTYGEAYSWIPNNFLICNHRGENSWFSAIYLISHYSWFWETNNVSSQNLLNFHKFWSGYMKNNCVSRFTILCYIFYLKN